MNKRKWFILRPLSNKRGGSTLEYTVVIAGALILAIVLYQVVSGEGASKVKDTVATILNGGTIEIAGGGGPSQSSPPQSSNPKPPAPKPPQPKQEEKSMWEQGLDFLGKGWDYATQPVRDLAGAAVDGVRTLGNFAADTVESLYQSTEQRSKLPYKKGTLKDIKATDDELRKMADLVYDANLMDLLNRKDSVKDFDNVAKQIIGNRLPENWSVVEGKEDPATGFQAMVFKNKITKEYIIAYRGTENINLIAKGNIGDWTSDAGMFFNGPVLQKPVAEKFTKELLQKYPDAKLTGHSLGGLLAQMMSVETGRPAVTWNAPGAKPHTYRNALTPKQLWDIPRSMFNPNMNWADDQANRSGKYDQQIRNYVNSQDAIGKYGVHYGQVVEIDGQGNAKEIDDYSMGQEIEDNIGIKLGTDGGELINGFAHHGVNSFNNALKNRQNIVNR